MPSASERSLFPIRTGAVDSNNEHHCRIVEALKQHDAQLAEKLANQHIMKTIENMDHYGWDNLLKSNICEIHENKAERKNKRWKKIK